jgi:hypothetical protein
LLEEKVEEEENDGQKLHLSMTMFLATNCPTAMFEDRRQAAGKKLQYDIWDVSKVS